MFRCGVIFFESPQDVQKSVHVCRETSEDIAKVQALCNM